MPDVLIVRFGEIGHEGGHVYDKWRILREHRPTLAINILDVCPSMRLEQVYEHLPIPLQHLTVSGVGLGVQLRRYDREFGRLLAEAKDRATWSQDRIERWRNDRLASFVSHAATTVPYYRRRFHELEIDPRSVRSLDDYTRVVPLLEKRTAQEASDELHSDAISPRKRRSAHTSGTTGAGLRFSTTWPALREQWAIWWRYLSWHGVEPGTWCGYFFGRPVHPHHRDDPPFWRVNWPGRQVLFSAYHMRPDNMGVYVDELRRRRLPWLHGYTSTLALLAAHIVDHGLDLGYTLRAVTTASENLLPHQRELMERAFGVRPRQHYAMTEAAANASECPLGELHIDEDFAITELVRDPSSEVTRVVGTNFSNPAFPLLRYVVHDVATLRENACPCGLPGRILASIDGREEDYIELADGTRIGPLNHVFKGMVSVREAQIAQRVPGEITLRIVPGAGYNKDAEQALLTHAHHRLGPGVDITIERHDALPRTRTGKLRLVVRDDTESQSPAVTSS